MSCFCLVLCILFAALWVRSYARGETLEVMRTWRTASGSRIPADQYSLFSDSGVILMRHLPGPRRGEMTWEAFYRSGPRKIPPTLHKFGFAWRRSPLSAPGKPAKGHPPVVTALAIPYWLPVLIFGSLTIAFKPSPHWRFSVRLLVAITTFFAIALWIALTLGLN